jgi:hypothetical protein
MISVILGFGNASVKTLDEPDICCEEQLIMAIGLRLVVLF